VTIITATIRDIPYACRHGVSGRSLPDEPASDMNNHHRELNVEELDAVTGGGIVDNVLREAEATTDAFLKRFAEFNQKFMNFINTPTSQPAAASQE
jgi:hypothetical protein